MKKKFLSMALAIAALIPSVAFAATPDAAGTATVKTETCAAKKCDTEGKCKNDCKAGDKTCNDKCVSRKDCRKGDFTRKKGEMRGRKADGTCRKGHRRFDRAAQCTDSTLNCKAPMRGEKCRVDSARCMRHDGKPMHRRHHGRHMMKAQSGQMKADSSSVAK